MCADMEAVLIIDPPVPCLIICFPADCADRKTPVRFKATTSALRCLEATLICVDLFILSKDFCDSKQWQKMLLPSGIKGSTELKKASMDIGCRLFPQHSDLIKKQKDADGLLIAEWARRSKL